MVRADISIAQQDPTTGAKKTQNITNVNPEASNQNLYDFATAINQLTLRTFVGVKKISTEEIIDNG